MKPTIKDVAKVAGVSFKTVSRVINRETTVGQDLQEKVWEAIKELNYQPNLSARGLRGTASSIGFIYDNPNSNYIIDMQNGLLRECREQGYELVIHPCDSKSPDLMEEIFSMIHRSQVGGLILSPPMSESGEVLDQLQKNKIRFVRIVSSPKAPDEQSPLVFVDDRSAAYRIIQYLIDLGHSRIAFLGGDEAHRSSTERLEGYRQALRDHRIKPNPDFILGGEYAFESGVKRTRLLLQQSDRPTAVFACNDEIAAGTLFAARLEGVKVPDELSIVGFEDSPFSRQAWPNLTTAQQPNGEIAGRAAHLLITQLRHKQNSGKPQSEGFYPQLVVRDSTCPPGGR